ncbi:unnamed protein product [Boreogadus saida]
MSLVLRQKLFPEDYQHHICQFESLEGKNCNISLQVRLHTEEEVRRWLQAFQKSSQTTWRVNKSYPEERQRQNMYRRQSFSKNRKSSRLEIRVRGMMEGLIENVQSGFDLYKAPMEKMLASYDRMTTDSQHLWLALHWPHLAGKGRISCLEDGEKGHASKHEDWSAADSCGSSEDATWRQAYPHYWVANKKLKKRAQLWKGKGQFTAQKAGTT